MKYLLLLPFLLLLPSNSFEIKKEPEYILAHLTAYSSEVSQTDSSPFISASGKKVRQGFVACPRKYPFGTKFIIEEEEYICEDRKNKRYENSEIAWLDIWFPTTKEAKAFGIGKGYMVEVR